MSEKTLVAAFIYHNNRVLLLQRSNHKKLFKDHFERPGGHKENADGSLEDAVARECLEEIGLNVEVGKKYFTYTNTIGDTNYTEHSFLVKLNGGGVVLGDEHVSYLWALESELNNYLIDSYERKAILQGFAEIAISTQTFINNEPK
jgi:8-oxo-dGTP pyrophosphatase MutT (NUDIX family)